MVGLGMFDRDWKPVMGAVVEEIARPLMSYASDEALLPSMHVVGRYPPKETEEIIHLSRQILQSCHKTGIPQSSVIECCTKISLTSSWGGSVREGRNQKSNALDNTPMAIMWKFFWLLSDALRILNKN